MSTFGDMLQAAQENTENAIKNVYNEVQNFIDNTFVTKYEFDYDVFPEDLGMDYYGHYMTITAKVGNVAAPISTGPFSSINKSSQGYNTDAYTVFLFIPSAQQGGSGIVYQDKHEYTDIKLTNLAGKALGAFVGGAIGEQSGAASILSGIGHPINPGVQVLYRSTNLRAFQFIFLMAPSSLKESQSMESIIKYLRKFAAPNVNKGGGGFLFDTPAEFEIKFYNKGKENTAIPKIRRTVLTDIIVDYTPQGEWSTFRNGYPVSAMLQLTFQEMEIITRDKIESGN